MKLRKFVIIIFKFCDLVNGISIFREPRGKDIVLDEILRYNYELETHRVKTPDGYILEIIRIPGRRQTSQDDFSANRIDHTAPIPQPKKPVAFMMHCIFCSGGAFIAAGQQKSLAYMLADRNYDVWLGNARGTIFSKDHAWLSPNSSEYWDYSFHEIGAIDVPAMIDYILRTTKQRAIHYVGFSQGATAWFVATSTYPWIQQYVKSVSLMAPAAYVNHLFGDLPRYLAEIGEDLSLFGRQFKVHYLDASPELMRFFAKYFCNPSSIQRSLCYWFYFSFIGPARSQTDRKMVPRHTELTASPVSVKQLIHYAQCANTGRFRMYDFKNILTNMKMYKNYEPPTYNLTLQYVPTIMFHGDLDYLVSPPDVYRLRAVLRSVKASFLMKDYNHMDFIFGKNVHTDVYMKILRFMDELEYAKNNYS